MTSRSRRRAPRLDELEAAATEQLRRFEPGASLDQPESPATRRAVQALARQASGRRPRGIKRPPIPRGDARLSARERTRAIDLLLSTFLDLPDETATEADWSSLERLTGLSYGRRGVSPDFKWLEGSASEATGLALPRFTFPAIRNALEHADNRQLEQARLLAQILIRSLPLAAGAFDVLGQRHAAGLDHLIALNDIGADGVAIFVAGLVLVTTQLDLAESFRGLAKDLLTEGYSDLEQLRDLGDQAREDALSKIENEQMRRRLRQILPMTAPADGRFPTPPRPPKNPPGEERTST